VLRCVATALGQSCALDFYNKRAYMALDLCQSAQRALFTL
jgi:hypothetical protein